MGPFDKRVSKGTKRLDSGGPGGSAVHAGNAGTEKATGLLQSIWGAVDRGILSTPPCRHTRWPRATTCIGGLRVASTEKNSKNVACGLGDTTTSMSEEPGRADCFPVGGLKRRRVVVDSMSRLAAASTSIGPAHDTNDALHARSPSLSPTRSRSRPRPRPLAYTMALFARGQQRIS